MGKKAEELKADKLSILIHRMLADKVELLAFDTTLRPSYTQ